MMLATKCNWPITNYITAELARQNNTCPSSLTAHASDGQWSLALLTNLVSTRHNSVASALLVLSYARGFQINVHKQTRCALDQPTHSLFDGFNRSGIKNYDIIWKEECYFYGQTLNLIWCCFHTLHVGCLHRRWHGWRSTRLKSFVCTVVLI